MFRILKYNAIKFSSHDALNLNVLTEKGKES